MNRMPGVANHHPGESPEIMVFMPALNTVYENAPSPRWRRGNSI
ncbi:hypothetical protein BN874_1750004 [Candidatus Contendobacter odensis Run_B_J11]|uniref:Uncharacterized protein n=1 Tax=Candidatus Contendobacter odensis Run_B_J11 TaxID=1400861 RepID=A0A7U7GAA5_9GAMM|nr:hypothetical protein BN874_1750004 [Candidatus Contendobacter odensis Run_B_J11]